MTSAYLTRNAQARPPAPLVVACLRHTDTQAGVDPVTGAVSPRRQGATAAPAEFAALEIALRIAQDWRAQVLALTAGDRDAEVTLREALAVGADALRVEWPSTPYMAGLVCDEQALAGALASAIRDQRPALVVCGDRSADRGTGALPAFLAHELGAQQALGLVELNAEDGRLFAQRRLTGGRRERLLVGTPAVCSVEAAGVRLRRASLPAVLAARQAVIRVVPAPVPPTQAAVAVSTTGASTAGVGATGMSAAGVSLVRVGAPRPYLPRAHTVPPSPTGSPRERLLTLTGVLAHREPPTVIGPVSPARAAKELLGYLERAGYTQPANRHGQPPPLSGGKTPAPSTRAQPQPGTQAQPPPPAAGPCVTGPWKTAPQDDEIRPDQLPDTGGKEPR